MNNNNYSVAKSWPIEKFARTKDGKWYLVHKESLLLRIHFDQLFLLSKDVVLETFSLNRILKGCVKQSTLIIIYQQEEKYQKLKFKFLNDGNQLSDLFNTFALYFTVEFYDKPQTENEDKTKQKSLVQMVEEEMSRHNSSSSQTSPLFPEQFPFHQFIKSCILDPSFPKLVDEIENFIKSEK